MRTHHEMSDKHFDRHAIEFAGRHNRRPRDTDDLMEETARGADDKQMAHAELIRPKELRLFGGP